MKQDLLLVAMILSYLSAIIFVVKTYQCESHPTLSHTICNQALVYYAMIAMGFFTILYEYHRQDRISSAFIVILLIGIYGLLQTKETSQTHYAFTILSFLSILGFMARQTQIHKTHFLTILLVIQIALSFSLLQKKHIFQKETALLAIFAIFYMSLHSSSHSIQ